MHELPKINPLSGGRGGSASRGSSKLVEKKKLGPTLAQTKFITPLKIINADLLKGSFSAFCDEWKYRARTSRHLLVRTRR